jgi:hypothetical protein
MTGQSFPLGTGRFKVGHPVGSQARRERRLQAARILDRGGLGVVFPLLLVWLYFDFGRPSQTFKLPMLISVVACVGWLMKRNRQWSPWTWAFFALLGVMALGIPLAANSPLALAYSQGMVILFLTVVLPLQAELTTVRRVRIWSRTLVAVCLYVAVWAFFHQGYGPAGSDGQDENYVSALVGMAVPFAYFAAVAEKSMPRRLLFGLMVVVFCGSMVTQSNPSRGGFLGLCAVVLYCVWRSPRRLLGFGMIAGAAGAVAALAGPAYWAEIGSSSDYETGTGDIRLQIWQIGLRMWRANPILGVGPGNFRWNLDRYMTLAQFDHFGHEMTGSIIAHSLPIELVSELGTIGLIAVLVLIVGTWRQLGRVVKEARLAGPLARERQALGFFAEAVRASILAVLANGMFLSLLYYSHLWLLIAVGTAIAHIHQNLADGVSTLPKPHRPFLIG